MLTDIDKNDVDIKKLFQWGKEFKILDGSGEPVKNVYIRLVGDADWNRARVKALRASGELRKKLRDTESDEYFAFIPDYESINKERVVDLLLAINIREYTNKVIEELPIVFPVEPSVDATLEEQEKYQKEIDSFPEMRQKLINDKLIKVLDRERVKLNKSSKEDLQNEYSNSLINSMCELEMGRVFYEYCTFYGSYKDKDYSEHLFDDIDEFLNLQSETKEQLIQFYRSLELGISELKK